MQGYCRRPSTSGIGSPHASFVVGHTARPIYPKFVSAKQSRNLPGVHGATLYVGGPPGRPGFCLNQQSIYLCNGKPHSTGLALPTDWLRAIYLDGTCRSVWSRCNPICGIRSAGATQCHNCGQPLFWILRGSFDYMDSYNECGCGKFWRECPFSWQSNRTS